MGTEATTDPNKHIKELGKRLDKVDQGALRAIREIYEREKYTRIADVLLISMQRVAEAAIKTAVDEIAAGRRPLHAGARSYGALGDQYARKFVPDKNDFALSSYYYDYLVELSGIVQRDSLISANMALAEAEKEGEGVNKAAFRLKDVLKKVALPRLQTIVRTEGTRVASAARRDIGVRAAESGLGPHWLIYTSILDDRVTTTCSIANNHKRPIDPQSPLWLEIPPPAHYNCRSMERYGFAWNANDKAVPDWDEEALAAFRSARFQEFPRWVPRQLPPPKDIFRLGATG